MKRSFLEKLAERYRELEIARRVYLELGGDDDEAHRIDVQRVMALDATPQGVLSITRRADGEVPAAAYPVKRGRPKKPKKLKAPKAGVPPRTTPRGGRQKHVLEILEFHPGGLTSRAIIDKWQLSKGNENQGVYQALHELKKRGVLKHDGMSGLYTIARAP